MTFLSIRSPSSGDNSDVAAQGGGNLQQCIQPVSYTHLVVGPGLAMEIVDAFLSTPFEGGRHAARVEMISEIEKKYNK